MRVLALMASRVQAILDQLSPECILTPIPSQTQREQKTVFYELQKRFDVQGELEFVGKGLSLIIFDPK